MSVSELEQIGYEQGMEDMRNYVDKMIRNAIDNPALDVLTPRQVLGILLASLKDDQVPPTGGAPDQLNNIFSHKILITKSLIFPQFSGIIYCEQNIQS